MSSAAGSASDRGRRALLGVVLLLSSACGDPPGNPEAELRRWLAAGQKAAEARDRRELMSMVAPGYRDARGNDPDRIENALRFWFQRYGSIELVSHVETIEMSGDTAAEVLLTVAVAGSGGERALDFRADAYRFALEVEHDGSDWRLMSARWGTLGGDLQ